jgi:hypothetical protein
MRLRQRVDQSSDVIMATDIFLSVGRTATKSQKEFVERVELLLAKEGFSIKRAIFSAVQPLKKISEVMQTCSGAVIIAHERLFIEEAIELRGSEKPIPVKKVKLPTVWNQIESAMAYTLDLPLLVICVVGLKDCWKTGMIGTSITLRLTRSKSIQKVFVRFLPIGNNA